MNTRQSWGGGVGGAQRELKEVKGAKDTSEKEVGRKRRGSKAAGRGRRDLSVVEGASDCSGHRQLVEEQVGVSSARPTVTGGSPGHFLKNEGQGRIKE